MLPIARGWIDAGDPVGVGLVERLALEQRVRKGVEAPALPSE